MRFLTFISLFSTAHLKACQSDEDLIKSNEGQVNFKPKDNITVCWGCNYKDMENYLNLDYFEYMEKDLTLTLAQCNEMFQKKV